MPPNGHAETPYDVRNIAVIGAGPSGVATAKFLRAEGIFNVIDLFEQRATVGGVWNYTPNVPPEESKIPQIDPHAPLEEPRWVTGAQGTTPEFPTPMYDRLETNIPRQIMRFAELDFPKDTQLFPRRAEVMWYLEKHAEEVKDLIKFTTQVVDVRSLGNHGWHVKTRDLLSRVETERDYDAVVVASGHYSVPYVPSIPGIEEWNQMYPGTVIHSKKYRLPEQFHNKKVLLIGNSASGSDIGTQVAAFCKKPLLVSQRSVTEFSIGSSSGKATFPEVKRFLSSDRAVEFVDGRLEKDVDSVIFCTGYFYSYPFLKSLNPPPVEDGARTQHVYKHVFYIPNPTLAFVAVPQKILPFPIAEAQSAAISSVWANRLTLPPMRGMEAWEGDLVQERGSGKLFHVFGYPRDADYINDLYDWTKTASPRRKEARMVPYWRERERWVRGILPDIKAAYAAQGDDRHNVRTLEELGFNFDDRK